MKQAKHFRRILSFLLVVAMLLSMTVVGMVGAFAAEDGPTLTYSFKYDNAGYAEGRVRLTASSELDYDKYTLYWADDTKALDGYAPITTINLNQESRSFTFGKHTAIPADATKLIAVESALAVGSITVDMADAVYDIPAEKQFKYSSADKEYTFQTLSDIHFHRDGYEAYQYADEHFTSALNAAQLRGAEFVATCGDNTNYGDAKEWGQYLATIANSNFTGPVFEVNGNHEPYNEALGSTAHKNILDQYKIATGLDTVTDKMRSELYYEVTAQNGDHHIFMALELVNKEFSPKISDNFSKEQMDWLEGLLNKYKNDGKKIFIYEHAPFTGYGAGDNKVAPHYTAAMTIDQATYPQTYRFKELLESNKDIVWFSGHTHIDFKYNYNIDNENGTTAYTVHVPSTASSTTVNAADNGLIYEAKADSAQGYFVDVYADATVLNGTDLVKNEILPLYTYLVDYSGEKLIENDVEAGEEVNYSKVVVTVDASVFNAKSVKVTLYGADDETLSQSVTMLQDADGLYKANVSTQFTKMKFVVTTDKYTISSAEYKVADSKTVLGAYKISYDNEYGWSNVNVYAWNTAGGELATWPGVAMTQEADGTYTAVIPNFPNMIIFNNGTGQTDDLEIAPYIAEKIEGSYTVNTTPTPPVEDAPVEPEVPVETTTIYFEKPDSWKGAYIYGFYGEVGQTAEKIWPKDYPGASMNLVDGNTYKCDVPVDIDYIKFCDGDNNGTNYRTDNISGSNISEGAVFSITGQGSKYWNWTVTAADIASVGAGVTTYVINSAKWDTVAAYYWDGASVDWPGTAMTKTGETVNGFDVYSVTISAAPKNIIFNNNNNGSQTDDLTFVADQYYDVKSGQWYATLADVPAVDTASTDRYLVGSFNGWSTVKNEFRLKAAGDAVAYVELELDANTEYEFKIIREGTWTSSKSAATTITGDVEGLTFSSSVSENTKMKTTEAGTYVFAFGISTSQLAITYPAAETPDTPDVPEEPTTEPTPEIPTEPECPTTPDGDLDIPADTKTIYFTNVENWANVYVYGFYGVEGQAATGEPLGTYPGTQMTFLRKNSQGQDIYTAEIPADIDYLKFSDGAATNERTNNIPNAKFEGEINGFYLTEKVSGKWNIDVYTYVPEPKPPVSTEPTTELTTEPTTEATVDEPTTEEKTDIPTTKTIYFTNNENWANVYVYGFYGVEGQAATGEPLGTYPGTQMTFCRKNSQGQDIYTAEIPADIDYLKFSDGAATNERTNNIPNATFAGEINGFYLTEKVSGKWNIDVYTYVPEPKPPVSTEPTTELTTEPTTEATVDEPTTEEKTDIPTTKTIYFTNNENWANVYVYGFYGVEGQAATGEPLGTYPGTQMTFCRKNSQGQDIYTAEIPADVDYLKFSDGSATNERTNNIPNATFAGDINGFYLTEKVSGKWNIDVYTYVPEPKPPVSTEPTTELTTEATVDEPTTAPTTETTEAPSTPVVTKKYLYGDVDMDTRVTVKDATAIQKHAAELMMITDIALAVADVDGNGSVNVKDATAIQKFAAELIEGFIAGEYYEVEEEGTTDSTDPTDPTDKPEIIENDLTKLLATVKNTLANENYYASYVAYAGLKKAYFNYKDANIAAMSDADIDAAVVEINVALVAYNTMKQNNPKHVNGYQAPKAGTYLLRGTMNNWDESGVMEKDGDGVSITYTLAAGEQKLKVYDVDTGKWYGNGGTFTDSCDGWTMSDTAGDLAFTATGGTYKFTVKFDGAKVKLSVAKIG